MENWVVSGSMDGTVSLWNWKGHIEKQFDLSDYVGNVVEWGDHLCVGLLTKICVLDENGRCVGQMAGQGSHNMTIYQGHLITSSDSEILIYKRTVTWTIARQLWIGCLKECSEHCPLATLPPEIIHLITTFV